MLTYKPQIVPTTTHTENGTIVSADTIYDMLEKIDELHSQVSDGTADSNMSPNELIAALRDLIYTAQETIDELSDYESHQQPLLRIVEKIERAG